LKLSDYIQSHVDVPDSLDLSEYIETYQYPKNHQLQKAGEVCRKLYFIEEGLVRVFYYKNNKDITYSFISEDTFTTLVDSFFEQKPSRYNMETLEASTVSYIKYDDLMELFNHHHSIEHFGRMITTGFLKFYSDRLTSVQFYSAEERYQALQIRHPNIISRVALGHIASYLGITQETLSRLRAKKV
jgi:CRP-like cAMP-binding protein